MDVRSFPLLNASVFVAAGRAAWPAAATQNSQTPAGVFGRGRSAAEAEAGCAGEAIESYCATFRGDEPLRRAPLHRLESAVDPRTMLLFSEAQYQARARINSTRPSRHRIPEPFIPDEPIEWTTGRRLGETGEAWIPAACCFLDYRFPPGQHAFASADLTGCATGRTHDEAVLHALLECVERDAVALWWYTRARRPAVDLHSLGDRHLLELRTQLEQRRRSLVVLDITTDLLIPVYVAISTTADGRLPVFGAAAHPIPAVAAWKAMSEAVLNWFCTRCCELPSDIEAWMRTTRVNDSSHLRADGTLPAVPPVSTVERPLHWCIDRLLAARLTPIVVDLSRHDRVEPVVRVVVPGLRHIYDRRGPGRLYDVPPSIGWVNTRLNEKQLNQTPCTW